MRKFPSYYYIPLATAFFSNLLKGSYPVCMTYLCDAMVKAKDTTMDALKNFSDQFPKNTDVDSINFEVLSLLIFSFFHLSLGYVPPYLFLSLSSYISERFPEITSDRVL